MKAIEIEAKEYTKDFNFESVKDFTVYEYENFSQKDFIAGANSKTVDEMILKAIDLAEQGILFSSKINNSIYTKQEILEKVKQEFL